MTSTQWVEYHVGTKRKTYNPLPTYNITAEAVTVGGGVFSQTDAAEVRMLSYNIYGEPESDSHVAVSVTHYITETRNDKGRSIGYAYSKNGTVKNDTFGAASRTEYTAVGDSTPTFDVDGNQALVKTTTGTWDVTYDAENCPVIECAYDHMGRRATKKVTVDGSITLHQRYLYRGYLQIACCDLTRSAHPCLWLITWDPTQPIATRPLAIQKDGTWYTYGWDLTKNICELYGTNGYIRTAYTYTPYGSVTESGNAWQPIQWSSEYNDTELGLVYYNYRHYNLLDGKWIGRDNINENVNGNLYGYVKNYLFHIDILGLLNLKDVALKLIEGTNIYWGNTCPDASFEFDNVTPVLMLGPIPLRIYGSISIGISPCYPKGMNCPKCELEANLIIEAYAQYGVIANRKNAGEAIRRRNKKKKGDLIFVPKKNPSMGSGESGITAGIETRNRCSKDYYSAEVYVFMRGSMGAGIGVYGSTQIKVTGTDVNYDDLLSYFHADAGITWGIYGASLEIGIGGKISVSKELPL